MDETTTVNVKSVRVDAWERAKKAAGRADETLGSWVSRACDQLAASEANGPRMLAPFQATEDWPQALAHMPPARPLADDDVVATDDLVSLLSIGQLDAPTRKLAGLLLRDRMRAARRDYRQRNALNRLKPALPAPAGVAGVDSSAC